MPKKPWNEESTEFMDLLKRVPEGEHRCKKTDTSAEGRADITLLLLNKPFGVLRCSPDEAGRRTLKDYGGAGVCAAAASMPTARAWC